DPATAAGENQGSLDRVGGASIVISTGVAGAARTGAPTRALAAAAAAIVTGGQGSDHQTQTQNVANCARHGSLLNPENAALQAHFNQNRALEVTSPVSIQAAAANSADSEKLFPEGIDIPATAGLTDSVQFTST